MPNSSYGVADGSLCKYSSAFKRALRSFWIFGILSLSIRVCQKYIQSVQKTLGISTKILTWGEVCHDPILSKSLSKSFKTYLTLILVHSEKIKERLHALSILEKLGRQMPIKELNSIANRWWHGKAWKRCVEWFKVKLQNKGVWLAPVVWTATLSLKP